MKQLRPIQPEQRAGQRWLRWKNNEAFACPPYGCIALTATELIDGEVVFSGGLCDNGLRNTGYVGDALVNLGAGWNIGFNSSSAVDAGEIGYWTCDLPTWGLVSGATGTGPESSDGNFMDGLISFVPDLGTWSLRDVVINTPENPYLPYFAGFQLLGTYYDSALLNYWTDNSGMGTAITWRIGWIGGLVSHLRGGSGEIT